MEANFENSEIQRISYLEDRFNIHTKKESNTIYYKELLDVESGDVISIRTPGAGGWGTPESGHKP